VTVETVPTVAVRLYESSDDGGGGGGLDAGAFIGIVVGSLACVACVASAALCFLYSGRKGRAGAKTVEVEGERA